MNDAKTEILRVRMTPMEKLPCQDRQTISTKL